MSNLGINTDSISYAFSEFLEKLDANEVMSVIFRKNIIEGTLKNQAKFNSVGPSSGHDNLLEKLRQKSVRFEFLPKNTNKNSFLNIIINFIPILFLIFVGLYIIFSGMRSRRNMMRSKATILTSETKKCTFKDVAGIDEAKEGLTEIVDFLKNPDKYKKLGAKIPKGCLLIGEPGTGKTLLARAIAGEVGVPFFSVSASSFIEMFVGLGASRIRDMFQEAKKKSPCIIFIDEIDSIGQNRKINSINGNGEHTQTLNQLLVEMDGFISNENIIIIAATNRIDILDPALLRPGRFDRQILIPLPDLLGRRDILNVHLEKIVKDQNIDPFIIACGTAGFSGADLANLVNEATFPAVKNNRKLVNMSDLEYAKKKCKETKLVTMDNKKKELIAYHEASYSLIDFFWSPTMYQPVMILTPEGVNVKEISPEKRKSEADIAVSMGPKAIDEILGKKSLINNNFSDIQAKAYEVAKTILSQHIDKLHLLAKILLEKGSLTHDETKKLLSAGKSQESKTVHDIISSATSVGNTILQNTNIASINI